MSIVAYKDQGYFTDCLYGAQSILWKAGDQHFHVGTALLKQKGECCRERPFYGDFATEHKFFIWR